MNLNRIYESDIEEAALEWFTELGYTVGHGPRHRARYALMLNVPLTTKSS